MTEKSQFKSVDQLEPRKTTNVKDGIQIQYYCDKLEKLEKKQERSAKLYTQAEITALIQ